VTCAYFNGIGLKALEAGDLVFELVHSRFELLYTLVLEVNDRK